MLHVLADARSREHGHLKTGQTSTRLKGKVSQVRITQKRGRRTFSFFENVSFLKIVPF